MPRLLFVFVAAVLAPSLAPSLARAAPPPAVSGMDPGSLSIAANRVRADIEFLASDRLEGRATGTPGHAIAADYVAAQMRAIGLEPAGGNGLWTLDVPFRRASHKLPPKLTLTIAGRTVALAPDDARLAPSVTERSRRLTAGLVFAGYGLEDRRFGFDDFAGLDLKGKLVVVLRGTPRGLPSDIAAHLNSTKRDRAAAHGAIGVIEVSRGGMTPSRDERPVVDWVDGAGAAGNQPIGQRVALSLSRRTAERLFAGAPHSLSAIEALARDTIGRPRGFALAATIAIEADETWSDFTSPEVVGRLRGGDPALANETIVLMGHLDHLGRDLTTVPGADGIYNGALDNAAGVATMLEAARQFMAGPRPRRSVLFIANTGEEIGLLGADYYAAHPSVASHSIVGVVDLDMPLLLYPFTDVTAFGGDHSTIAEALAAAGRTMGVSVAPDPMPQEAIFVRSDHYMFVKRGVPAVLLTTGHANGGAAIWGKWMKTVYHSPHDDLSQAIDWNAGARYAILNYRLSRQMADAAQRPRWYQGDYFGDLYDPGGSRAPLPLTVPLPRRGP